MKWIQQIFTAKYSAYGQVIVIQIDVEILYKKKNAVRCSA